MAKISTIQSSFNSGEISPRVSPFRIDIEKYYSACRTLENFIPLIEGGVTRVPGTYYITPTKSNGAAFLVPFKFSTTQQYVLEFGNLYIRFYKDEGQISLTYSAWQTGQAYTIGLLRTNGGNYYRCLVAHTSGTFATDLSAGYWAVTGGSTDLAYEIPSPYATADLFQLKFFQSADTMWITHPTYPIKQLTRTAHTSWTLSNYVCKVQNAFVITNITKANPAVVTVTYTDTDWAISTAYSIGDIRLHQNEHYYCEVAHTSNSDADLFTSDVDKGYWSQLNILEAGQIVYISGVGGMTQVNGNFYDVGTVTDGSGTFTFQLSGIDSSGYSNYTSGGSAQQTPFGTTNNNPSCGTFFEQRIIFAGTNNNPQTIWGSKSGDYDKFTQGVLDDDAFEYGLVSTTVDRIFWCIGRDDYVYLGTPGGIWRIGASSIGEPLTATNVSAKKFFTVGGKNLAPEIVTDSLMWATHSGKTIRKAGYSLDQDQPVAVDMTRIAKHITYGSTLALSGIKQMAFQREPLPILWCVRNDGQLLGMTYETQENVYSWFRIKTDGLFESITIIGDENEEEQVWVVVNRTIGDATKRYIEYFKPYDFYSQLEDCFYVHSGLTWDGGATATVTTIPLGAGCVVVVGAGHPIVTSDKLKFYDTGTWLDDHIVTAHLAAGNNITLYDETDTVAIDSTDFDAYVSGGTVEVVKKVFTGLSHLEGEEVTALGSGAVIPSETVASGSVTLDRYVNKAHIGLPYDSILEPIDLNIGASTGSSKGKTQKISRITLGFHETVGGKMGPDTDNLKIIPYGTGVDPVLFTGYKDVNPFNGDWGKEALITIVQDQPLPMTVTGLVAYININEG
jgi:hypothetical protein